MRLQYIMFNDTNIDQRIYLNCSFCKSISSFCFLLPGFPWSTKSFPSSMLRPLPTRGPRGWRGRMHALWAGLIMSPQEKDVHSKNPSGSLFSSHLHFRSFLVSHLLPVKPGLPVFSMTYAHLHSCSVSAVLIKLSETNSPL